MIDETGFDIETMTPEQVQELVNLGIFPGEQDILKQQMEQANLMRNKDGPEGRTVRDNIYTAANPLEHLGAGLERYKGSQDASRIEGEQRDILGQQAEGRARFFEMLRGRGGGAPGQRPGGAGPTPPIAPPTRQWT